MRFVSLLLLLFGLSGCAPADYPGDWPAAGGGRFDDKGSCPDLSGDFDGVRGELLYLLGRDPDFEKPIRHTPERRGRLDMAADGSTLDIALELNERGLAEYRERALKHNTEGVHVVPRQRLRRGEDYECDSGWLQSLHFPQPDFVDGLRRMDLKVGRDRDGGLIAGARLRFRQQLGWGDSPGIEIWSSDQTHWHRWPARPAAADTMLTAAQSVTLHRHGWVNHGRSVPTRFTSFYVEPICLRFEQYGVVTAPQGPEMRRGRDELGPLPPTCPDGWGKFDLGETFRTGMDLPDDAPRRYRFEWFPLSEGEAGRREIVVSDPRELPLMPGESERGSR